MKAYLAKRNATAQQRALKHDVPQPFYIIVTNLVRACPYCAAELYKLVGQGTYSCGCGAWEYDWFTYKWTYFKTIKEIKPRS